MLQSLSVVALQVAVLFVLMGVGAVCAKTKFLSEAAVKGMVSMLVSVVTPCVIVHAFQREFRPELLAGLGWAFAISILVHLVGIAIALLAVREPDARRRSVLRCAVVFSNAGFMGIPLEKALLGDDGVFFGAAYVAVFNVTYWSWGLVQMCGSLKDVSARTLFVNPGTVGIALGLPLFFASYTLPPFIGEPVKMLADLNTPLAMVVIGFYLASADFGPALRCVGAYAVSALRLCAIPLVVLAGAYAAVRCGMGLDRTMLVALVTASAAPVAAMTSMFAVRYGRDVPVSVGLVSGTTLLSIVTIPPVVALAMWLFGVRPA